MVKKLLAFLLAACVTAGMGVVPTFAMEPYEITYNIHSEGENEVTAEYGDIITVTFEMIRTDSDDETYFLNSYQNEIEYDMDFFELDESSIQMTYPVESNVELAPTRTTGQQIIKATYTQVTHNKEHVVCTFELKVIGTHGSGTVRTSRGKCSTWDESTMKTLKNTVTTEDLTVTIDSSGIVNVEGVSVTPTSAILTSIGETLTLTPKVIPDNASNKSVTYSSSNVKIATVNDRGVVTAVSNGTAVITVTTADGNKTATCTVTVTSDSGGNNGGGTVTVKKYTLTFDTDGGSEVAALEARQGTKISLSQYVSEKVGYDFDGWYSDSALTQRVTEIALTADTTVYAKWVASADEPDTVKPDYKPEILTDEHYAYIVGRESGMIAPESDITRAEVATVIYRLLDEDERNKAKTNENVFTDVNEGDWFNTAVSTLANLGLVNGRTLDTFAPNDFITRAELATVFARMVEIECDGRIIFSDVSGHWAESYINEAATAEWIVGYNGLFRPDDNITRAEVMTLVNRVLNREPESKADLLDGMTTWKDNADEAAWYYPAVQEATNSHTYEMKADGKHEKWTSLTENPDWSKIEG